MNKYKILSVKIVPGNTLNPKWKSKMQVVTTDKGVFIYNMPGKQFGFFGTASPGANWPQFMGDTVNDVQIFNHSGYKWINKKGNYK